MLRSKQLLPFVKGARSWIVAGSVSKPPPLDGTVNPAGNEEGKPEQGYNGTKASHSTKSPPQISRSEDSPFGRDVQRPGAQSAGAKFEKIHESSTPAFIPGPSLSRRSGAGTTVSIPGKDVSAILPSLKRDSAVTKQSPGVAVPAVSAVVPGETVKTQKGQVLTADSRGKTVPFVAKKPGEVGLASLSRVSDQEATYKNGSVAAAKPLPVESRTILFKAGSDQSGGAVVSNAGASSGKAVPLKNNTGDNRNVEPRPPPNHAASTRIPVSAESIKPSVGNKPSLGNKPSAGHAKAPRVSEGWKETVSAPDQTIIFGTVNASVVLSKETSNLDAEVAFLNGSRKSSKPSTYVSHSVVLAKDPSNLDAEVAFLTGSRRPTKPSPGVQHPVSKQSRPNGKGVRPEPYGVSHSGGQGPEAVGQKSSRSSKGRDANTGISNNRRRANGFTQAGGARQSHWSAKDSGSSGDMVDQVGGILRRMGWTSQTVNALANLNSRLNAFHINEVLKHQREPGLAWEFFNWAKTQSGYKHDVRTYTTMIGILGRVRNFEACDRLLHDMRLDGCDPSVVTFNRLIHSYGRANYLGEALNLFHKMQEVGCPPDRVTYVTLMDLYSKAGFHDIAMDICQKMWQAGFEPDTFSYTVIINCLGKAGNLPAAFKMFLEMIDSGHTPNLVTYNTMIDLHAKAGKHHMALKLYNDMQDSGFRPDNVTYSVIMEVLGHSGHLDEAENVFFEMEQAGWSADATTFGSLVYMWGQTGNVQKATEWYRRMLQSGLSPNVPTCNSLLWAYMRVNDYEAAGEVLDSMPKWGLSPTLPTYTLLLSSCTTCENQQDVDFTLQIMSRTGHLAHSFVCGLLNEVHPRESTARVHQFFDNLHEEEQENKRSFTDAIIEFLYKLDHKEKAGAVWEVAMEKNLYHSAISQRAPNFWIVDLHVMSMGTAVVALLKTLASFRERMIATGVVPDRIEIVTGWGKHSRVSGFSKIKNVVDNVLGALDAPFYVDSSNVGCFVGSGQPLVDWLHEPDMGHRLAL